MIVSFICELRSGEKNLKTIHGVCVSTFDFIIQQIGDEFRKDDTHFRRSISPGERLLITSR